MAELDKKYLNEIEKQLGYFGVYPPNRPIALGDYGRLDGDEFEKHGNIKKWIEPRPKRTPGGNMLFMSKGEVTTDIDFGAADKNGEMSVDLKLTFGSKWSVFFLAQATTVVTTGNLARVGDRIVEEYRKKGDSWELADRWVAELVEAEVLTVMVSQASNSVVQMQGKLPLKYKGLPVGNLDLRNFKVTRNTASVAVHGPILGATPLFKLYRVTDPVFEKADYAEAR